MPRAIWSGSVSFGLVNVPVKLVTATSTKDVRFNQLHDKDGGRIVIVEPEELQTINPEATRAIDIEEFVDLADIDPIYFEHSYYLVPDERAERPYALLVEAMDRTGKVALGSFVLRTKQYLAALRPRDGVLVLSTML